MRILCLDYGEKRIGVALSDPFGWTAQPFPFISNAPSLISTIQTLVEEHQVETILIGLPKTLKNQDSQKTLQVRAFSDQLAETVSVPVKLWDERLSTVAAEKHLISANLSRAKRKTVIDSQAAVFILQGYLDSLT